jgi:hypothetical protein
VGFDGAWQKRFRGSHIGIGFIIDTLTGLVIDMEVLSTHCFGCRFAPSKDEKDDDGNSIFDAWFETHEPICSKNFEGSSQAMEQELGIIMWERSIELHKFRYTEFLGDGDSKTFDELCVRKVYGDVPIEKVDCINHVSKRMGTALRDFHENTPAARLPAKGRFLKEIVPKLQNYYGNAIKSNTPSVDAMHDGAMSALYHMSSTDAKPRHDLCPKGEKSFCFFQRALAKEEDPPTHDGHDYLSPVVFDGLLPIYERLADKNLLQRCTKGLTTNPNEAIHSLVWSICPKETFVSLEQVQIACIQAAVTFNEGHIGVARTIQGLQLPVSREASIRMRKSDMTREMKMVKKMSAKGRRTRAKLKLDKAKTAAQKRKWSGQCYGYGLDGRPAEKAKKGGKKKK